jgi:hypothetical protein
MSMMDPQEPVASMGLIGRSSDTMLAVENHVLRERINRLEEQVEKQKAYIIVLQQRLIILGESHFPRE